MKTADRTEVFFGRKKGGNDRALSEAEKEKIPQLRIFSPLRRKIGLKESAARQIAENVEETVKRRLGGIMKKAERL